MNIQKIQNRTAFCGARLFDDKGNEIKKFGLYGYGESDMSQRGGDKTDIAVKEFISQPDGKCYSNLVRVEVRNPLFGTQQVVQNLYNSTINPIKGNKVQEFYAMDSLTSDLTHDCKDLENEALKKTLLQKAKENLKNGKETNPVKILDTMINKDNCKNFGFFTSRLSEFKAVALNLYNELLGKGLKQLK
ncbi:hypothetical protein KBA27_06490 [bacterium]|nr:hypothetical protein [bacterium]